MKPDDLDRRYLPEAARRLRALLAWSRGWADAVRRLRNVEDLKALDDRYAARGPLALVREVPQLGFVVIAVVFLVGAGTVITHDASEKRRDQTGQQTVTAPGQDAPALVERTSQLGPSVGAAVPAYLAVAAGRLSAAARTSADDDRLALVSFSAYRSPVQVVGALQGVDVRRVYLRAPAAGSFAAQVPVEVRNDLAADLAAAYTRTAKERTTAAKEFRGLADSIEVTSDDERKFKAEYQSFATTTGKEAQAYSSGCACVFAAVVEGPVAKLQQLRARPGVRVVEVATGDVRLAEVEVLPLLPETKTKVPARQASGG